MLPHRLNITGGASISFCALPTYIANMFKILESKLVQHAGSCATNVTELVLAKKQQIPQVAPLYKQLELHLPNNIHM